MKELPTPFLHHQYRPQPICVLFRTDLATSHRLDVIRVEYPDLLDGSGTEHPVDEARHVLPEQTYQGNGETHLPVADHVARQDRCERPSRNVLEDPAAEPEARCDFRGQTDHPLAQDRYAPLQRECHAHAVLILQEGREVRLCIEVHQSVQGAPGMAASTHLVQVHPRVVTARRVQMLGVDEETDFPRGEDVIMAVAGEVRSDRGVYGQAEGPPEPLLMEAVPEMPHPILGASTASLSREVSQVVREHVGRIPTEHLVPPVARQDDPHMTAREFSYEPARDHSGSTLGLIEMPHELGELGRNAAGGGLCGGDTVAQREPHLPCPRA